ncbi:hypothetical protein JOF56_004737 [Kibdelosporangium banguiense]|uniref:Uncharacterized protein n=1 Tax=Kibdelosporangium banguiense TaxID=1365924 RepID=A0ABS4TIV8_9PSEU|nr:hypothetical protein [Kibdelosporangium banguiense]
MTTLPTIAASVRVLPVVLFGDVTAVLIAHADQDEHRLLPTNPATSDQAGWSR